MVSSGIKNLAAVLGVPESLLNDLDKEMASRTGKSGLLEAVSQKNQEIIGKALSEINSNHGGVDHVRGVLRQTIVSHEKRLLKYLDKVSGKNEFEKAAELAIKIIKINNGFFLKKENIKNILIGRPPEKLMDYLGYKDINDLVAKEDLMECFSALRFIETDKWMHKTFDEVYSAFTPADFEERPVEIRVLGPKWYDVAKKFVAKKHHNVSHLKEFGVIFLNPIQENIPGKFLRDFALLLHYFHEIQFYSKLFKKYSGAQNFSDHFKSLLRGDVKEIDIVDKGEWLIVQRYLTKENPNDPRLYLPRVNPESIHWSRGEKDLADFFKDTDCSCLDLWGGLNWVGGLFEEQLVSFDLEDNAMSLVSFMEGKEEFFFYHQREAMWTKIFSEYAGGGEEMEKLIIDNFENGIIKFG